MRTNEDFYPLKIGLDNNYSKILYLQELCNKYGDFYITTSIKKENGEIIFWKHRSVLRCWESEKGLYFLKNATHRTPLRTEVFLDLDDNPTKYKLNSICELLKKEYEFKFKAYSSGGKGYHIHVRIPELVTSGFIEKRIIENIKKTFITKFNCDLIKKSDKTMIALEGCPHWRNENIKTLISYWGWNNV